MRYFLAIFFALAFNVCFCEETVEKICSSTHCYTVIREVGEGAFGKVKQVVDEKGNEFALKCFKDYRSVGADDPLKLATQEFECGQLLDHPNIIKTYEVFIDDEGVPCLLLEFVDGKDLFDKRGERVTPDISLSIALQYLSALRHALSVNLYFLDSNEGNIMINKQGNLKLIDLSSFSQGVGLPTYFDAMIEKCLLFIRMSDLNREAKFALFFKIKQIAWSYYEDFQEGREVSLDHYVEEVMGLLKTWMY